MRPFRFVLHLKEFGWQPTVLTIAAPGQTLTPKEAQLLSDVEIIELDSPLDRTSRSESQLGASRSVASARATEAPARAAKKKTGGLIEALDRQFPTDTWLLLFAARYRELRRIVQRVDPDVLWCTGDPWSALVATWQLARTFDLPWVADFRDPWTISAIRAEGKWPVTKQIDAFLERKIIESANAVVFQAGSVEQAYHKHYSYVDFASRLITNSFDPSVFDDPITIDTSPAKKVSTDDGLHIGFFGRFRAMSPATVMADALHALHKRAPAAAERIHVHSFGPLNQADAAYAEARSVASSFHRKAAVPLERSLSVLRQFDLLLVSTDLSRHQIIPAKIFEYLPANRPILSLSRNDEVRQILEETGTGLQLDPTAPDHVAEFLLQCLEAVDQGKELPLPYKPDETAIRSYEARETTRALADVFDSIT